MLIRTRLIVMITPVVVLLLILYNHLCTIKRSRRSLENRQRRGFGHSGGALKRSANANAFSQRLRQIFSC